MEEHAVACARERALAPAKVEKGDMDIESMFHRFDRLFFSEKLKNKVDFRFSTLSEGWAETAGATFPKNKYPKIRIVLNRALLKIKRGALKRVQDTLVHEMIHAYCMLENKDDDHGPEFQKHMRLKIVRKHSRKKYFQ